MCFNCSFNPIIFSKDYKNFIDFVSIIISYIKEEASIYQVKEEELMVINAYTNTNIAKVDDFIN